MSLGPKQKVKQDEKGMLYVTRKYGGMDKGRRYYAPVDTRVAKGESVHVGHGGTYIDHAMVWVPVEVHYVLSEKWERD